MLQLGDNQYLRKSGSNKEALDMFERFTVSCSRNGVEIKGATGDKAKTRMSWLQTGTTVHITFKQDLFQKIEATQCNVSFLPQQLTITYKGEKLIEAKLWSKVKES